jgi:lipopolysaccharide biosynthesis glycosyltransferase
LGVAYEIALIRVSVDQFSTYKWLGGYMTYARFLIPQLVAADKVLYLDSDLIVNTDVAPLFDTRLVPSPIGAVTWTNVGGSNDARFFRKLGADPGRPYFNAGVLLMQLEALRHANFTPECLRFASTHQAALPSADQTVLNHLFGDNFLALPRRYNSIVNTTRKRLTPAEAAGRILHFVGFPKPWSFLGEAFHPNAWLLPPVLKRTAYSGYHSYDSVTTTDVFRLMRKGRSYLKCLTARFPRPRFRAFKSTA